MKASKSVITSGPNRPRSPAQVIERLEQIERDTHEMQDEAIRLAFSVDLRQHLMDQGHSLKRAQEIQETVSRRLKALEAVLGEASEAAAAAARSVHDSGVILTQRFEWRPTRGRR